VLILSKINLSPQIISCEVAVKEDILTTIGDWPTTARALPYEWVYDERTYKCTYMYYVRIQNDAS